MDWLERLYHEKELTDIKNFCIKNGLTKKYLGQIYYLYNGKIYDKDMSVLIANADNGFLDLFEYFEYFEQPTI